MNDEFDDYLPAPTQGGDLAPYAPGAEWLPASAPGADYVPDLSHDHGAAPVLFGQRLPPGVSPEAAQRGLADLEHHLTQAAYQHRIPQHLILAARQWFRQAASSAAPRAIMPAHPYRLHGYRFEPADEPYVQTFCNHMWRVRASEDVVRKFLSAYTSLVDRLQQAQQAQQPQRQPSYGTTLDDLSDAQYQLVMARAEADKRAAMDELRTRWGHEFAQKLQVVKTYFAKLPAIERDHLDSLVTQGGRLAGNSSEFIVRMYEQAVGSRPSGANLQTEIDEIEHVLRTDRKRYNRDLMMQARYRELLRHRG